MSAYLAYLSSTKTQYWRYVYSLYTGVYCVYFIEWKLFNTFKFKMRLAPPVPAGRAYSAPAGRINCIGKRSRKQVTKGNRKSGRKQKRRRKGEKSGSLELKHALGNLA